MTLLITGGTGQLGRALQPAGIALGSLALDITDADAVTRALDTHAPRALINAAAYTAVDMAESERDRAFAINRDGPRHLAIACARRGVKLLHVSTDYVFDGEATTPYRENHPRAPLGVYGESKAAGEDAVFEHGGTVVRTSWLFGEGGPSFVHTMLRLARERPVLKVVADQRGCPTYAGDLAQALLALAARNDLESLYNFANDGETTWHAFATAVITAGRRRVSLACERIEAITTADYPTPARRPAYSVLDTSRIRALGIVPPPWTIGLERVVAHALSE